MMKSYPKDQKDKVMKKLMELSSQEDIPIGAFSQLAKEEGIPKATIYLWSHNLKVEKQKQAIEKNSTASTWSSQAKFQAVLATSSMSELQLGEYLRSNRILKEELDNWRVACQKANDMGAEKVSDLKISRYIAFSRAELCTSGHYPESNKCWSGSLCELFRLLQRA